MPLPEERMWLLFTEPAARWWSQAHKHFISLCETSFWVRNLLHSELLWLVKGMLLLFHLLVMTQQSVCFIVSISFEVVYFFLKICIFSQLIRGFFFLKANVFKCVTWQWEYIGRNALLSKSVLVCIPWQELPQSCKV